MFSVSSATSNTSATSKTPCFHCGLPAEENITATINDESQHFCCIACKSVAQAISLGGLSEFYLYRDELNNRPESSGIDFSHFDHESLQKSFVKSLGDDEFEVHLIVSNMSCAACAWLIEHYLEQMDAVEQVRVNVTTGRLKLHWSSARAKLSEVLLELHRIGYDAQPYQASEQQDIRQKESKRALMRLGVAGIGMMQVGMFAIALHAGDYQSMELSWRSFFRWVSLIVATPVVFFSARPFFDSAIRALKQRHLNMDVPVSLAIGLAYVASVVATLLNTGEVYFDSVSMFTFFLLLGRFIEMRARHSRAFVMEDIHRILPLSVERVLDDDTSERVPLAVLQVDDVVCVQSGATIPCDGVIVKGKSHVDESMLTGEAVPIEKSEGDLVYAGSQNVDSQFLLRCHATGDETRLALIGQLFDNALMTRPRSVSMADAIASKFVFAVLVLTSLVAAVWWWVEPSRAIWVSLSVLVATCPCALSLATPTAITAGTLAMKRLGLVVLSSRFVETLANVQHVVFDKTGTLTEGKLKLSKVILINSSDQVNAFTEYDVVQISATIERVSQHPIAHAFTHIQSRLSASELKNDVGNGVKGVIYGKTFRLGKLSYACPDHDESLQYPNDGLWLLLSCNGNAIAWLCLDDQEREGVSKIKSDFSKRGLHVSIVSGDRDENVQPLAEKYNWNWAAKQQPEDKLTFINTLQKSGQKVLMVGDGINDVPVLGGADLSIAMGGATSLAKTRADAVLLSNSLEVMPKLFALDLKIKRVIRQNLTWALFYNATVLPIAAFGFLPPYLAAIGMSASSLFVVLNAVRLSRVVPV